MQRVSCLLVALVVALPACESAEQVGQRAGVKYIAPFIGVAEARTEGCDKQLELARHMRDHGKSEREELRRRVEKVKGDDAFQKGLKEFTDQASGSVILRFAADCPTQAKEVASIAQQIAEELAIADVVPAWPPSGA